MSKFNKIKVYYRQTSHNKISPTRMAGFDYERCFKSFLDSVNPNLVDLTICFDGSLWEYDNHFTSKYQKKYNFKTSIINTNSYTGKSYENDGSSKSSCLVAEIIKRDDVKDEDLIFTLENDYIFKPIDWALIALDLYNNYSDGNLYCSLYEHLDTYIFNRTDCNNEWSMYKDLQSKIFLSYFCRWRVLPAITSSWIFTKSLFERDFDLHSIGISDNTGCLEFRKRGSICVGPLMPIMTHSESYFLAPYCDWNKVLNSVELIK